MRYLQLLSVFLGALLCVAVQAERKENFRATNATTNLLHTHDDYVREMPAEVSADAAISNRAANAKVDEVSDLVSKDGTYHLRNEFAAPGLASLAHLYVVSKGEDTLDIVAQLHRGASSAGAEKGRSLVPIKGLESWHPGSRFDVIMSDKSAPIGNNFIIVQDTHVYTLMLIGPVYFDEADDVRGFLQPKLDAILAFQPDLPPAVRTGSTPGVDEAKIRQEVAAETQQIGNFFGLLLFYLLAGGVGLVIATVINNVAGRPRVPRLVAGIVCVIGLAGWFLYAVTTRMDQHATPGGPRDYVAEGKVIGDFIWPAAAAIVVLVLARSARRNWKFQQASFQRRG